MLKHFEEKLKLFYFIWKSTYCIDQLHPLPQAFEQVEQRNCNSLPQSITKNFLEITRHNATIRVPPRLAPAPIGRNFGRPSFFELVLIQALLSLGTHIVGCNKQFPGSSTTLVIFKYWF